MNKKIIGGFLVVLLAIFLSAPSVRCDPPASPDVTAMNCATCHNKQVKSLANPVMHASVHAARGIGQCTVCHDPSTLKETHAKLKPGETKFVKARRYPQEFCLKCHGTYADLSQRTAAGKALTDSKGRVVNPHDLPKTPQHSKLTQCGICHKEHKKKMDIVKYCQGCHHTGEFLACKKCHANK